MNPVMTMITRGRRALGEDWSKVTVTPNPDTGQYDIQREDTPAPADGSAIFVPALGNLSIEMADYILEAQRKEAEYRARHPQRAPIETETEKINRLWHDYVEWKKKMLLGQTVSGPGGTNQRERISHGKRSR